MLQLAAKSRHHCRENQSDVECLMKYFELVLMFAAVYLAIQTQHLASVSIGQTFITITLTTNKQSHLYNLLKNSIIAFTTEIFNLREFLCELLIENGLDCFLPRMFAFPPLVLLSHFAESDRIIHIHSYFFTDKKIIKRQYSST